MELSKECFTYLLVWMTCFSVLMTITYENLHSNRWTNYFSYENRSSSFNVLGGKKETDEKSHFGEIWNHSETTQPTLLNTSYSSPKVALVVPYRNRPSQLPMFIAHMFPFLARQGVNFTMFLVEQDPSGAFNLAKLFNVGYNESSKYGNFNCFIFHDVDLLPENDTNLYQCEDQPKHMSVAIDKYNYRLPYSTIVGGVLAMNKTVFQKVNGFSNLYFGWGSEDDDMAVRIREHGFNVIRQSVAVARYRMIKHQHEQPSPSRNKLVSEAKTRLATDGLNTLNYTLVFSNSTTKYVHIMVKLKTVNEYN